MWQATAQELYNVAKIPKLEEYIEQSKKIYHKSNLSKIYQYALQQRHESAIQEAHNILPRTPNKIVKR